MAVYKDKLIKEYIQELKPGTKVTFEEKDTYDNSSKVRNGEVVAVNGDKCQVLTERYGVKTTVTLNVSDVKVDTMFIGYDPLIGKRPWQNILENTGFNLDSMISTLGLYRGHWNRADTINGVTVQEVNWNPYTFDENGNKQYYQRDFCWTLEDKQNLIESIYNDIDCGKIIVRKRSWQWLETQIKADNTEVAFYDIVDGKQRLNALFEFMTDKFPDKHGYYYSDFSDVAQRFFGHKTNFSFLRLGEKATDEQTLHSFLAVNFTGVQMSADHIKYVENLYKSVKR